MAKQPLYIYGRVNLNIRSSQLLATGKQHSINLNMRTIKKLHSPIYAPIDDLVTYRAIPTHSVEYLDPFLFLNHHGPQTYGPQNGGLPFGPHPHRGMETVTFILDGDILHLDNSGSKSVIQAGGVQWMSAGKGLIHSEISSDGFKQSGGKLEILQLWVNLPARHKMAPPTYKGLQKESIPVVDIDNGKSGVQVVSGTYAGVEGPFQSVTGVQLKVVHLAIGGILSLNIPKGHNIFFYVINGELNVNNIVVEKMNLVEFENDHDLIQIAGLKNSRFLLGHAVPLNEPVVSQGPFVMNTYKEIEQAYVDYQNGAFGTWPY